MCVLAKANQVFTWKEADTLVTKYGLEPAHEKKFCKARVDILKRSLIFFACFDEIKHRFDGNNFANEAIDALSACFLSCKKLRVFVRHFRIISERRLSFLDVELTQVRNVLFSLIWPHQWLSSDFRYAKTFPGLTSYECRL